MSDMIFFTISPLWKKKEFLIYIVDLFLKMPLPKDDKLQKNGPINGKHVCTIWQFNVTQNNCFV